MKNLKRGKGRGFGNGRVNSVLQLTPFFGEKKTKKEMDSDGAALGYVEIGTGKAHRARSRSLVLAVVAAVVIALLGGAGLATTLILLRRHHTVVTDYGVMLDAGSSGTRAYVYSWPHRSANTVPVVAEKVGQIFQVGSGAEVKPGLAKINTSLVSSYLAPLFAWAQTVVPADRIATTPVYLRATAGMRMVPQPHRDELVAAARAALAASEFSFQNGAWAAVISGEDEGVFGWVTANYLTGALFAPPERSVSASVGALDMGGASLQISFVPEQTPKTDLYSVSIANRAYKLYTHTFLGYGQDTALVRLNERIVASSAVNGTAAVDVAHPCFLAGYSEAYVASFDGKNHTFHGSGEVLACLELLQSLINVSAPCPVPPCSFEGAYQPPLRGHFFAMSGFFFSTDFLGVSGNTSTPAKIQRTATLWCSKTWDQARREFPKVSPSLLRIYCYSGLYIPTLLTRGFQFPADTTTITFTGSIGGTALNWALGSMISEAALLPWGKA